MLIHSLRHSGIGSVSEIMGPVGSGKTTAAVELCVNTIAKGGKILHVLFDLEKRYVLKIYGKYMEEKRRDMEIQGKEVNEGTGWLVTMNSSHFAQAPSRKRTEILLAKVDEFQKEKGIDFDVLVIDSIKAVSDPSGIEVLKEYAIKRTKSIVIVTQLQRRVIHHGIQDLAESLKLLENSGGDIVFTPTIIKNNESGS